MVVLDIPVSRFQTSIFECGNRKSDKLLKMSALEAFVFLESILWGEPNDNQTHSDLIEKNNEFEKFNICTNFSESFDGESLYLLEDNNAEIFIWKAFNSKEIRSMSSPSGTYQKVIRSFLDWFNSQVC